MWQTGGPPVLHRIIIVKLLTQHVRRLLGTHQWHSALLVVGLPVTQDWFEMGCHLSSSPVVFNRGSMNPLGARMIGSALVLISKTDFWLKLGQSALDRATVFGWISKKKKGDHLLVVTLGRLLICRK